MDDIKNNDALNNENNAGEDNNNTNNANETNEKTFTQADIDRIVQERLAREKSKYTDYEDLKELSTILDDFDYADLSVAEKKKILKQQADEYKAQKVAKENEELEVKANEKNIDPELYKDIEKLKQQLAKFEAKEQQELEKNKQLEAAKEKSLREIKQFQEKYTDIDLEALVKKPKFKKLLDSAKPDLTLIQIYEDLYMEFNNEDEGKKELNNARATSSGKSGGNVSGRTYGLTAHQRSIADESGMSYEAYSELLKNLD
jgi:hypothetical protein